MERMKLVKIHNELNELNELSFLVSRHCGTDPESTVCIVVSGVPT